MLKKQLELPDTTVQNISSAFNLNPDANNHIGSLVVGILCKNLSLPCPQKGLCVQDQDIQRLFEINLNETKILSLEGEYRNQSMLRMRPMLLKILGKMQDTIDNSSTKKKFALYSGHDMTVRPLIQALGINDFRWPRLASRVIFELWMSKKMKFYVKIYYNDEDVTGDTVFCKGKPWRCRVHLFKQYVTKGILAHFNSTTYEEACTVR